MKTIKLLIVLLFLGTATMAHDTTYKKCVDGKLEYYTHVGGDHNSARFITVTYIDKNGNPLTGNCAKATQTFPIVNEAVTFRIDPVTCLKSDGTPRYNYTRIKVVCSKGDYEEKVTVENSITCKATLPIKVYEFEAKNINNVLKLNWKTSDEVNFSHFNIEHSYDTKEFFTLGTTTFNFYSSDGDYRRHGDYVRLKCVDLDGSFSYTKIVFVKKEEYLFIPLQELPIGTLGLQNGINTIRLRN